MCQVGIVLERSINSSPIHGHVKGNIKTYLHKLYPLLILGQSCESWSVVPTVMESEITKLPVNK